MKVLFVSDMKTPKNKVIEIDQIPAVGERVYMDFGNFMSIVTVNDVIHNVSKNSFAGYKCDAVVQVEF